MSYNLDRHRNQHSVADLVHLANHRPAGVADMPSLDDDPVFVADLQPVKRGEACNRGQA
jgi:hypothetical protein